MKTAEELNALKQEAEALNKKLRELSDEELRQVAGGFTVSPDDQTSWWRTLTDFFFKIKS